MAELGTVVALIKSMSGADPAVIEQAVQDWLDDHPEATTTVQDGSITEAKLAQDVLADLAEVEELKEAIAYEKSVLEMDFEPQENTVTLPGNYTNVNIIENLKLKAGTEYTFVFTITSAKSAKVYCNIYDGSTVLKNGNIAEGTLSLTLNYTPNQDVNGVMVRANVPNTISGTVVTASVTSNEKNRLDRIEGSINALPDGFVRISYSSVYPWGPINTAEVFKSACFVGFNAIKGDVRITSDGKFVMCHDAGFTLDGNGRITTYDESNNTAISTITLSECLALEHSTFRTELGYYAHPCSLDEYLEIVSRYNKVPFITIRDEFDSTAIQALIERLDFFGLRKSAIINSYGVNELKAIRAIDNMILLHIVADSLTDYVITSARSLYPCAIGFNHVGQNDDYETCVSEYNTNATMIEKCRDANVPLFVSQIFRRDQYEYARKYGFKGAQMTMISEEYCNNRSYRISALRTSGEWAFNRNLCFEQKGTITESSGNVSLLIDDVVPSWLYYLPYTLKAKSKVGNTETDETVTVTDGKIVVTPGSIVDNMQLIVDLTI